MAGFKKRREERAKIEELGEAVIFDSYIRLRSVRKLLAEIGVPNGHQALYDWLHEPDRWQRWQETGKIVADRAVDNIVETVETVTPENAAASRVKLDGEKWLASMHNREAYGNSREPDGHRGSQASTVLLGAEPQGRLVTLLPGPARSRYEATPER